MNWDLAGRTAAIVLGAGAALGLLIGVIVYVVFGGSGDVVDRESYAAGWASATTRQGSGLGSASASLRTDDRVRAICKASAVDGRAEQEGATDRETYLRGCFDALDMTRLEPSDSEITAEFEGEPATYHVCANTDPFASSTAMGGPGYVCDLRYPPLFVMPGE